MPEVIVTLKCKRCGKSFVHKKETEKGNSQAYRIWAKENITLCPTCFNRSDKSEKNEKHTSGTEYRMMKRESVREKEENMLEGIKLADLQGSEKQIEWATDIRRKAICKLLEEIEPNKNFYLLVNEKTDADWWIEHQPLLMYKHSFIELLIKNE